MAVSLVVHALIISLQFGAPGIGLPALELPWHERRTQPIELQVALAPPASPAETASIPTPAPDAASAPPTGLRLVPLPPAPAQKARKKSGTAKPAASRPPRARIKRETPVIALNDARDSRFNLPAAAVDEIPPAPEPEADAPAPPAAVPEEDMAVREREQVALRQAEEEKALRAREAEDLAARQQQEQAEAARMREEEARARALAREAERLEAATRREEAERLALALEERRKSEEANRQAAALALRQQQDEVLRREREEAARRAMELEEKQRAETMRLQEERLRRETIELHARKLAEAAAAAARERERQAEELAARRKAEADAASASAVRRESGPELVLGDSPAPGTRIDALPRGLGGGLAGRALEQAGRGDVLRNDTPSARQSENAADQPRRRSFLGGKDVDVGVMMYVESWRLKIERNGSIMYPRAAVDRAQGDPVVTVAVRSDGSVENVVIHRSSGRSELDEAVHRIVRVNARYSAFPPELARRFDVIEIRKVWNFDDRLRILEEVR